MDFSSLTADGGKVVDFRLTDFGANVVPVTHPSCSDFRQ
jgi:hypothetical protein